MCHLSVFTGDIAINPVCNSGDEEKDECGKNGEVPGGVIPGFFFVDRVGEDSEVKNAQEESSHCDFVGYHSNCIERGVNQYCSKLTGTYLYHIAR